MLISSGHTSILSITKLHLTFTPAVCCQDTVFQGWGLAQQGMTLLRIQLSVFKAQLCSHLQPPSHTHLGGQQVTSSIWVCAPQVENPD